MTKPTETAQPQRTPEEQAWVNRVMTARALGQDFINILSRTNTAPDVGLIVGFGIVASSLAALAKYSPEEARAAVDTLVADFNGLVDHLGLGEASEPAKN
jgi:hypothetical protein